MSNPELDKRKRAYKAASAISKTDGAPSSSDAEQFFAQWVEGKLTGEQLKAKISALYKK